MVSASAERLCPVMSMRHEGGFGHQRGRLPDELQAVKRRYGAISHDDSWIDLRRGLEGFEWAREGADRTVKIVRE